MKFYKKWNTFLEVLVRPAVFSMLRADFQIILTGNMGGLISTAVEGQIRVLSLHTQQKNLDFLADLRL